MSDRSVVLTTHLLDEVSWRPVPPPRRETLNPSRTTSCRRPNAPRPTPNAQRPTPNAQHPLGGGAMLANRHHDSWQSSVPRERAAPEGQ
eukprot:CAMPEP_0119468674 /NCGR_PEP_ID=MMETSP1344-20130328/2329_1 /TAXON_ID=236787 /ORGANISM="Florenciella parvula, Strain CCMP2471" /LENGTH=88 /DNA_ID=CAMNT_0007501161 /DNA_START=8 /DNA_END=271 /DNA_ORIENTATION=+